MFKDKSINLTNADRPRLFGLEVIRAIAILSVLFYHFGLTGFFNAGFLGVDVFFNLSGFLITALILREFEQKQHIDIAHFYLRRIQRLFPAAGVLILSWLVLTPLLAPGAYARFCQDLPAAFLYMSNWWQIYSKQSYFETFGYPPLLQHLWSLAVEEQFYIVWPLVLAGMLRLVRVRTMGLICLTLALASTIWMAYIYEYWVAGADPSRAYLGTDSHAMGLLLGAALACYWSPWSARVPSQITWVHTWRMWLVGPSLVALVGVLVTWHEGLPVLFLGGFLVTGLLTLLLIVGLIDIDEIALGDGAVIRRVVACVRWIGTRSYSIYLWHWPIFIVTGVGIDMSVFTLVIILCWTAWVSELSYRCVEQPIQRMKFRRLLESNRFLVGSVCMSGVIVIIMMMVTPLRIVMDDIYPQTDTAELTPSQKMSSAVDLDGVQVMSPSVERPKATVVANSKFAKSKSSVKAHEPERAQYEDKKIVVIGDSVALGARDYMVRRIPDIKVDAMVGRQAQQGLQVVKSLRQSNEKFDYAVIHLGTNGYIVESQFTQLLEELSDLKHVTVFNVYANRRWMEPNNEIIERVTRKFPNSHLINWYAMGKENPQYFVSDGIHLTNQGIIAMVGEISRDTAVPLRRETPHIHNKPTEVSSPVSVKDGVVAGKAVLSNIEGKVQKPHDVTTDDTPSTIEKVIESKISHEE